jgi:hypothetical protein
MKDYPMQFFLKGTIKIFRLPFNDRDVDIKFCFYGCFGGGEGEGYDIGVIIMIQVLLIDGAHFGFSAEYDTDFRKFFSLFLNKRLNKRF